MKADDLAQGVTALNPNHRTLQSLDGQWQKLTALLLFKLTGGEAVEIGMEDIRAFPSERVLVCDGRADRILLRLVSEAEGQKLVQREGGRPA